MLKFQIKNYDEFRQIFGTRRSAIGTIRNKVLLDFWKSQFLLENFEDGECSSVIKNVADLYLLVLEDLQIHSILNGSPFRIKCNQVDLKIQSAKYATPALGCVDFNNPKNIMYLDKEHVGRDGRPKLSSMGAGRFFRKLSEEHKQNIPESLVTFCSEEFQRRWESDAKSILVEYKLVVDKSFSSIYSSKYLQGKVGSCMTDKNYWSFYNDSVDASAAYLVGPSGKIYSRCVIFHHVKTEDGVLHNYADRQYAVDGSEILKTILVNKLIAGGYIDIYKQIGAGAGDSHCIIDVKTGGKLSNTRVSIPCWIKHGDKLSYMDTFKCFNPTTGIAANYEMNGYLNDFSMTSGVYRGDDSHFTKNPYTPWSY